MPLRVGEWEYHGRQGCILYGDYHVALSRNPTLLGEFDSTAWIDVIYLFCNLFSSTMRKLVWKLRTPWKGKISLPNKSAGHRSRRTWLPHGPLTGLHKREDRPTTGRDTLHLCCVPPILLDLFPFPQRHGLQAACCMATSPALCRTTRRFCMDKAGSWTKVRLHPQQHSVQNHGSGSPLWPPIGFPAMTTRDVGGRSGCHSRTHRATNPWMRTDGPVSLPGHGAAVSGERWHVREPRDHHLIIG